MGWGGFEVAPMGQPSRRRMLLNLRVLDLGLSLAPVPAQGWIPEGVLLIGAVAAAPRHPLPATSANRQPSAKQFPGGVRAAPPPLIL